MFVTNSGHWAGSSGVPVLIVYMIFAITLYVVPPAGQ